MALGASPFPEKVLNRVVDSLQVRLSAPAAPSEWLADRYPRWREFLASYEIGADPLVVELHGLGMFRLLPSSRPYEFTLVNPRIARVRIWNPDKWLTAVKGQTGQLHVEFRSRFLQLHGLDAVQEFLDLLRALLFSDRISLDSDRPAFCRVSRIDLAVDVQMSPLGLRDLTREDGGFVRRAVKSQVLTTLSGADTNALVSGLLDRKKHLLPPKSNKGGATYTDSHNSRETSGRVSPDVAAPAADWGPDDLGDWGTYERVGRSAARAVAAAVRQDLASRKGRERTAFGHRLVWQGQDLQTLYFGDFASPLYARIYDKVAAVVDQDKYWLFDVWRDAGWDAEPGEDGAMCPVWRTEFSLSGDFLHHLSVVAEHDQVIKVDARELSDCLEYIGVIWRYCSHSWLRHVHHTDDSNPWRWPSSSWWSLVETAMLEGHASIKRVHARQRARGARNRPEAEINAKVEALEKQVRGLAVSVRAISDVEEAPVVDQDTGEILARPGRDAGRAREMVERVLDWLETDEGLRELSMRRVLMGLDSVSDTALSALFRAETMAEGKGS